MPITSVREAPPAPKAVSAGPAPVTRGESTPRAPGEEPSAFHAILHGIGREVARGEATVRSALHAGGSMGAAELLALQAGVYRYSESVDLAAKLVDRASSGVRTVVQGQG